MSMDNIAYNLRTREMGLKINIKKKNRRSISQSLKKFAEDRAAEPDTNKSFEISRKTKSTFLVELSPDGKFVASSHGDHTIRISEISTGKCVKTLVGHTRTPWTMAFHSMHLYVLASGCMAGEVRIWDLKSGESDSWTIPDKKTIFSVCFHPSLPILLIAVADRIYAWDWTYNEPSLLCTAPKPDQIRWVKFHPTGNWLYTGISNGFVSLNATRQTSSTNYFLHFMNANNNNANNNNNNEEEVPVDDGLRTFSLGNLRPLNRDARSARRGVFVPGVGDRDESSGEDENSDYFVLPTRERNQDRDERHRRYRSSFINYTRDRTGSESAPRTSGVTDYFGQVRDIWQQRLHTPSYRVEGRSRSRAFPEASPERASEGNSVEERVFRRLSMDHSFSRFSTRRDAINNDLGLSIRNALSNDQTNRRFSSMMDGQDREEPPATSLSFLSNNNSRASNNNSSSRQRLDINLRRVPFWERTEENRMFSTSGTSFQNSSRSETPGRMSSRSARRSALLRSDPILSDYGGHEEPLFLRNQDLEAAGTSDSTNNNNNESAEDESMVLDLSMNLDVESGGGGVPSSSGAVSSRLDGVLRRGRSSEQGSDQLQVEVEEHLNNINDMTIALRSRINQLREYIEEFDAAAAPGAVEQMNADSVPPEDAHSIVDVSATGHGTSMEVTEGEEDQPPSSNVVQLGTLNDLFAAALGGDEGLPGLDEPIPSTSGGVTSGGSEVATDGVKGLKRRRSILSSDEECTYAPYSPSYPPCSPRYVPSEAKFRPCSPRYVPGDAKFRPSYPTNVVTEDSQRSESSGSNSDYTTAQNDINNSSDTIVNTSTTSNNSNSPQSSSFSQMGNGNSESATEPSTQMEGSSRTMPVAVVFTFNSPTLSPTRFSFGGPSNPRTSSRMTGSQEAPREHRQSSPFRSLGSRRDEFGGNDDDEEEYEVDGNRTDSIARDHNYQFSRGGGRGVDLGQGLGEGAATNSRTSFMETFFLRRNSSTASTSTTTRPSSVSRQAHFSLLNPRNRFRVPTPPRNTVTTSASNSTSATAGTSSSSSLGGRRHNYMRFFNSTNGGRGRGGVSGWGRFRGWVEEDDDDIQPYRARSDASRRVQLRGLNPRFFQVWRYDEPDDEDDEDEDDIERMDGRVNGVGRSMHAQGSDDDIPLFGLRNFPNQIPRAEPEGRSRSDSTSAENPTFRIQAWNFNSKICIDLKKAHKNVVVPYSYIHGDASVDISQDGRILCTFVVTDKTVSNSRKEVGLFSLEPSTLGQCLCFINLESPAISLSISPNNHYLLVGVSLGRFEHNNVKSVVGSIFKLRTTSDNELKAEFDSDITHLSSNPTPMEYRMPVGSNCAKWFLGSGEGFIYGTNKGDMVARSHKLYHPDMWSRGSGDGDERPLGDQGMPWSWFAPGQMRLADFLMWSAQNNIGPVIV